MQDEQKNWEISSFENRGVASFTKKLEMARALNFDASK